MIKIGDKTIGLHTPPFIIAEMSGNHNQSLERAFAIIDAAADAASRRVFEGLGFSRIPHTTEVFYFQGPKRRHFPSGFRETLCFCGVQKNGLERKADRCSDLRV